MNTDNRITGPRRWLGVVGVAALGAALLAVALVFRGASGAPEPAPTQRPVPLRVSDEGSLIRKSPEEEFLAVASRATPKTPMPVDLAIRQQEARRVFGSLREVFLKMKGLAELYKKADPARYAAEMESLKEELTRLLQAAKAILKDSEVAALELFRMIREESDPLLKERMTFLLRFVEDRLSGPFALALVESPTTADRRAAIDVLQEIRSLDSGQALLKRAASDPEPELRRRSMVGMGRLLSVPIPGSEKLRLDMLDALRAYTEPSNDPSIRAAAWDAFCCVHPISTQDQTRIRNAVQTEKDPAVRRSLENVTRRVSVQTQGQADQANPKNKQTPQ